MEGISEILSVMGRASRHQTGMVAIAVFKLFKGALLLLVGFGLLELMHADIATVFSRLLEFLHINADTRLVHALVLKVDALQPHSVLMAGLVSLGYAALLLAEGIGLWLELSWAAYLTVVSTSALVPFEVYELIERATLAKDHPTRRQPGHRPLPRQAIETTRLAAELKRRRLLWRPDACGKDSLSPFLSLEGRYTARLVHSRLLASPSANSTARVGLGPPTDNSVCISCRCRRDRVRCDRFPGAARAPRRAATPCPGETVPQHRVQGGIATFQGLGRREEIFGQHREEFMFVRVGIGADTGAPP